MMFLKNFFKDTKAIILVSIGTFLLLEILVILSVNYAKKIEINNYQSVSSPDAKTHIEIANTYLTEVSKIFYDLKIDNDKVKTLMYRASKTTDKEKLSIIRKNLLDELSTTYKYMLKYNVKQLHFQLPNSISFLRFHKPDKYGDSLIGVRETLEYVNEYRTAISAFEEGRIFDGFRNVYPIYKGDEFVGTVEVSFSFEAMKKVLLKIDATTYLFMLNDKVIDKKVFNSEKSNYIKSEFSDYSYDKRSLKDITQIGIREIHQINKNISKDINYKLSDGELFSTYYKDENLYDNHLIEISFIPIQNIDNKVVAYVIMYKFGDFIDIIMKNMKLLFIILTLLALFLTTIFIIVLIHEKKKQKAMHDFAVHDALTKIYNRHGVNEILNQKLEESKRDMKDFSVIFFDIDLFKKVNDIYGHDMGDYVLENIANIVSNEIRASDIFARWGGEEFIIFLPNTKITNAIKLAEKLRILIQEHAFSNIERVTCSFGVTQLKEQDSKSSFLKRVDSLLYEAKASGRNIVISDSKS